MHDVYIGLGSNQQNPLQQIRQAIQALHSIPESRVNKVSSLYGSQPMGPQDQPDYVNAVACLSTQLDPLTLLCELQSIENKQGRVRQGKRWGPRTLDLDILLYGMQNIAHPDLSVPHPGMKEREFVLYPLLEISPKLHHPDGQSIEALIQGNTFNKMHILADS